MPKPEAATNPPETQPQPDASTEAHGRRTMPAGRVLLVMLVALLAWAFLYAPTLERASEAQPLGTRRTVSLWVLRPLASLSNFLQVTEATDAVSSALGKDPDAAPGGDIELPLDIPTAGPGASATPPPEPVTRDTKIRAPTPRDKLRVVVVGDSLAQGLGFYMEREFRPTQVRLSRQGRISTGLSRLDYFDWLTAMRHIENAYRPDVVIVMVGDNDNQSLQSPDGQTVAEIGSIEWPTGYEDRVEEFTRIAIDGGAHVAWVGLPIVQEKARWPVMQRQNEIFERVMERTPNAVYVDTWDRFATGEGDYTPFHWEDGDVEVIRATDGLHFNPRGYELVAQAAIDGLVEEFRLAEKALT